MRKLMLFAGAAALGLSAPLFAQGHGHGGGHGGGQGGGQAAQGHGHGGGQGHGHGNAGAQGGPHVAGGQGRGHGHGREAHANVGRGNGHAERAIRHGRGAVREARQDQRRLDRGNARLVREAQLRDGRDWAGWSEGRLAARDFETFPGRRLAIGPAGCPPGLARHNVYCMPPGQLRKAQLIGQRLALSNLGYNIPDPYRYRFGDSDRLLYRYGNDGMIYGFDRNTGLVSSVIPVASTGLYPGQPLPLGYYDVYNVPMAYRSYYPDSANSLYRYDGNAIYRVNSNNMMVDGIVALLTGGNGGLGALGVGDRLPLGYSAYNVPLAYRGTYYDTPDAMYRYADNSIYQIDPQTQLIQSIISLLV